MNCVICEKLKNHYNGICSSSIYEFDNSLVVLGEHQFYKYYCMVLAKECVREVHHLPAKLRNNLMEEVFSVGAFLEEWTGCKKINYSCLGNAVPHIHWHIFRGIQTIQISRCRLGYISIDSRSLNLILI